ncbi:MAG: response regulator [Fidelibacterota bacterium]
MCLRKKNILIVEDDLTHQLLAKYILKDRYNTFIADSFDTALNVLNQEKIDLILLDIKLNGPKSGFDLVRYMRTKPKWKHLPIIAVTAYALSEDMCRCLEAGCTDYLAKPFDRLTLLKTIKKLMQ